MITPIVPLNITSSMPTTFQGIWLTNIQISAVNPSMPVQAFLTIQPWNVEANVLSPKSQVVCIPDVYAAAASSSYIQGVMSNLLAYVQTEINSGSIAF